MHSLFAAASYVYAPQKGASSKDVVLLDNGLINVCKIVYNDLGKDLSTLVGGGAAGAMAGGMSAFFGAEIRMGIETVLDVVKFNALLDGASIVFTGEGKLDSQSLQGKVIEGVAKRAKLKNVPVIAIVGGVEGNVSKVYEIGVNSVFTINRLPEDFSVSRTKSEQNLLETMDNVLRVLKI